MLQRNMIQLNIPYHNTSHDSLFNSLEIMMQKLDDVNDKLKLLYWPLTPGIYSELRSSVPPSGLSEGIPATLKFLLDCGITFYTVEYFSVSCYCIVSCNVVRCCVVWCGVLSCLVLSSLRQTCLSPCVSPFNR